jgi:hypothetical protein
MPLSFRLDRSPIILEERGWHIREFFQSIVPCVAKNIPTPCGDAAVPIRIPTRLKSSPRQPDIDFHLWYLWIESFPRYPDPLMLHRYVCPFLN